MDKSHGSERRWKRHVKCQVRKTKMNESEQPMTYRKAIQLTSKPNRVVNSGQTQTVPVYGLGGVRCRGCMIVFQALMWNVGTYWFNFVWKFGCKPIYGQIILDAKSRRGGSLRSSFEAYESMWSKGSELFSFNVMSTRNGRNIK